MVLDRQKIRRAIPVSFETREESDGQRVIQGYFAVFNQPSELWPGVSEVIKPGAFAGATDVRALINHDTTLVMGRTKAGTLEIKEDSYGLYGKLIINEQDTDAMNLYARINRGDVSQASFGGYITQEKSIFQEDGKVLFEVEVVDLWEVSPCTFPQYEQTDLSARRKEVDQFRQRKLELEKEILRRNLKKWA